MISSKNTLKGKFIPKNPSKYIGDYNNIIFRSSWERIFMTFLDEHNSIVKWSSEELNIRYFDPTTKKYRRYFPDFIITKLMKDGTLHNEMIEIKPYKQTQPPKYKRKTKNALLEEATYIKNMAKWTAAQSYCIEHDITFRIITEKELGL